ncbi:FAD-dependent oxidoreductase [Streptomyces radiopugnans]|uniref:2-polyprenyl-6-methoxyphenol hydroxylase n=1 Tax=Streptomyces radiopugnans TaxID=403935 RepID=A0A1H9DRU3_9ACTN|nr:FAD-dependent oxidoreductase [Streptomyces radiopugnans]SEQ15398.1 2-polyprenyl-6-methoxyphenol hydroxylase [Streptomyces radiopugnans]
MSPAPTVLIVGGGICGNALAVLLRRAGIGVDLVEVSSDWNVQGSGITLQGNALRVLREVGVWEEVGRAGFGFDTLGLIAPDGTVLHVAEDIRTGGPGLPATLGIRRPDLQRVLTGAVRAAGVRVRLGCTVESLEQDGGGVDVRLTDGTAGRYDLVVAADGLGSPVRAMIGIEDRPEPTGMGIWRVTAPRPRGVERTDLAYGGPAYIAGYCPTGEDSLYAYLVEPARERAELPPSSYAARMRELAAGYGGAWEEIRSSISEDSAVNYTWFHRLLVEGPWHRGRVVLAGDAAHACPPTLAQGAAMSLEDALVLAELLAGGADWDEELPAAYRERRMPRVRMVVENSVRLGAWLMEGVRDADVPGLIGRTMTVLGERP